MPNIEELQIDEPYHDDLPQEWRYHKDHPKEDIINSPSQKMMTRAQLRKYFGNVAFVSQLEPKSYDEVQSDES